MFLPDDTLHVAVEYCVENIPCDYSLGPKVEGGGRGEGGVPKTVGMARFDLKKRRTLSGVWCTKGRCVMHMDYLRYSSIASVCVCAS